MPAFPGTRPRSAATASSPRCRCCGSIRASPAACCGGSPSTRRRPSIRSPMRSPERSCTRCAAARWRRCARCRSRNITAASMRRRCSSCSPASMSSAPATTRRWTSCGPRSRRRCAGSTACGDPDGDGFVEYQRATEQGLANQGWKDSYDAIFHADGRLAEGNIALAEVQGYVFAGKRLAARCAQRLGRREVAHRLEMEAHQLAAALRGGVLVRGARHLRAGARRRQATVQGAHVECRASAVQRHRSGTIARAGSRSTCCGRISSRAGASAPIALRRGALQPDVLSQRLDLAARQCADRARACALRPEAFGRACVQGPVRRRDLHGPAAVARIVLRLPPREASRPDALSRRLRAAGLGQRDAVHAAGSRARARIRRRARRDPAAQSASAGVPQRGDAARSATWALRASICAFADMATTCRWRCCAGAARFRCRSCSRIEARHARHMQRRVMRGTHARWSSCGLFLLVAGRRSPSARGEPAADQRRAAPLPRRRKGAGAAAFGHRHCAQGCPRRARPRGPQSQRTRTWGASSM